MAWQSIFDEVRGHGYFDPETGATWFAAGNDEYGNPTGYVDANGNTSANPMRDAALLSSDPWTRRAAEAGNLSGTNDYDTANADARQFAQMLGIDPAQAIPWFEKGVQDNYASPMFAGATDQFNKSLASGWGMLGMAQSAGKLTPEVQDWLVKYVDDGNTQKDIYNDLEDKKSTATYVKFASMLGGLAYGGFSGALSNFNPLGVSYDPFAAGGEFFTPGVTGGTSAPGTSSNFLDRGDYGDFDGAMFESDIAPRQAYAADQWANSTLQTTVQDQDWISRENVGADAWNGPGGPEAYNEWLQGQLSPAPGALDRLQQVNQFGDFFTGLFGGGNARPEGGGLGVTDEGFRLGDEQNVDALFRAQKGGGVAGGSMFNTFSIGNPSLMVPR
jgi:hypothetical protein